MPRYCSSTATSRKSTESSSPPSRDARAHSATKPRPHLAALVGTRFGGRSTNALLLLPYYLAARTMVTRVSEVEIPRTWHQWLPQPDRPEAALETRRAHVPHPGTTAEEHCHKG